MATKRPRYTVSVDEKLFQRIEDFRFERRYQTRSEATVELIRLGLKALEEEQRQKQIAPLSPEQSLDIVASNEQTD